MKIIGRKEQMVFRAKDVRLVMFQAMICPCDTPKCDGKSKRCCG